jgi:hypothetical protein
MDDEVEKKVSLFANNVATLLTSFYGQTVRFDSMSEQSLGGNMKYEQFLARKWNWNKVVNLQNENKIFDKTLSENITLRPL